MYTKFRVMIPGPYSTQLHHIVFIILCNVYYLLTKYYHTNKIKHAKHCTDLPDH